MAHGRKVKKVFESKPKRSRRTRRPRLKWLEDVVKVPWEMKVKRWRQKTLDEEWSSVMKEAKALRGL
jgi:hypothetical protein